MTKAVAVFMIHSEQACPERSEACIAVHKQLVLDLCAAPVSCVISDTSNLPPTASVCTGGSKGAIDRQVKHASAWALAAQAGRAALVIEDDVTIHDMVHASKFSQQRKHECVILGRWGSAYLITSTTAEKLVSYFARSRRPAGIVAELQSAVGALCLTSVVHTGAAEDGSDVGTLLPSATAGKSHPGTAALTTLDAARDLYETSGHPDVAIKYASMLAAEGYMIKAYDVYTETYDRVRGRPDGVGSTPFTRAYVELFKGAPAELRSFTSSW
jgi:hypothetical protein